MSTVQSVQDIKKSRPSARVAIVSMLLIPLVGVGCLLFPDIAEEVLPYFLGVPMVLSGAGSIVTVARERNVDAAQSSVGTAIVLCILGMTTIVHGSKSTMFIGIIWGLLGLYKVGGEFDQIIASIKAKEPYLLPLGLCVFQLVLAVLLILNPFANIEHHLLLLGLELIVYPFKVHREHGKFKLEAEA
ncbi:DUF308 domain-containing protein [Paraeggerthella hominis]|uniref:DUF308 domain-containing protein n=1 Tax=Paraeggerthella hominis TaxID=2897351 RepID=UPI003D09DE56